MASDDGVAAELPSLFVRYDSKVIFMGWLDNWVDVCYNFVIVNHEFFGTLQPHDVGIFFACR